MDLKRLIFNFTCTWLKGLVLYSWLNVVKEEFQLSLRVQTKDKAEPTYEKWKETGHDSCMWTLQK